MKYMSLAVTLLLAAVTTVNGAGDGKWSYLQNGRDWQYDKTMECHLPMQSPIDLRTEGVRKMNARERLGLQDHEREFNFQYTDLHNAEVRVKGFTVQVDFKDQSQDNYFQTQIPAAEYGGPEKMNALQFHFHAKSEHTIDGQQFDFEMHTVHLPEDYASRDGQVPPQVFASALGLIFDRERYDKVSDEEERIIDEFFDSLNLENEGDVFTSDAHIPYRNLMNLADLSNRWVYKGGLTTPPCTRVVFFQVVHRILPMKDRWYQAYLRHQAKVENKYQFNADGTVEERESVPLDVVGNFRAPVPYTDDQELIYLLPDQVQRHKGPGDEGPEPERRGEGPEGRGEGPEGASFEVLNAMREAFGEFLEECDPRGPPDQCSHSDGVFSSRSCCARMAFISGGDKQEYHQCMDMVNYGVQTRTEMDGMEWIVECATPEFSSGSVSLTTTLMAAIAMAIMVFF